MHETSLAFLASRMAARGSKLLESLLRAHASRVLYHHVSTGEDVGLLSAGTADRVAAVAERPALELLTSIFRETLYAPMDPRRYGSTILLLLPSETVASCFESGYFTFATGPAAACVMYEDAGSLRAVRSEARNSIGTTCAYDGDLPYYELEVISGKTLFPAIAGVRRGQGTLRSVRRATREHGPADLTALTDPALTIDEIWSGLITPIRSLTPRQKETSTVSSLTRTARFYAAAAACSGA